MGALVVLAEAESKYVMDIDLGESGRLWLGILLGLYMVFLFVLSLFASKNIENEEDFLVAGRRLGLFLCWGSLIATWFGAASMTGASQAARDGGVSGTVLDPWACSFTLIIAGLFYAKPLWKMKLLTTGDFFRRVYGRQAENICCGVQIPSYFGWVAGQYIALGAVQTTYFQIPRTWGIIIGFAIALIYTMVGGMWSVTLTDTVQIVIAFLGLLILGYTAFESFGDGSFSHGVSALWEGTPPDVLSLMPSETTAVAMLAYVGTWSTGLFGNLPGQDLQQRMFSAKDGRTASLACIISGVMYLAFGLIPVAMGLMSRLVVPPDIPISPLMFMAGRFLTVPLAVIFVVSFVSIVMSTACSAVLAPATILGHNFLSRIPSISQNKLLLERICVCIISLGGLGLAFSGESTLGLLDLSLSIALVGLFVPLTMGIYGKPRGQLAAILATVLGVALFAIRTVPEKIFLRIPESITARGTQLSRFEEMRDALNKDERKDTAKIDAIRKQAREEARLEMEEELKKYVSAEEAKAIVQDDEKFDAGYDWNGYLALRYSTSRVGAFWHQVLQLFATIPADLYGLLASFAGYFFGQWILAKRGLQGRSLDELLRAEQEAMARGMPVPHH